MWKIALLLIAIVAPQENGQQTQAFYKGIADPARDDRHSDSSKEPSYQGKPLSFWLNSLQNRDRTHPKKARSDEVCRE